MLILLCDWLRSTLLRLIENLYSKIGIKEEEIVASLINSNKKIWIEFFQLGR